RFSRDGLAQTGSPRDGRFATRARLGSRYAHSFGPLVCRTAPSQDSETAEGDKGGSGSMQQAARLFLAGGGEVRQLQTTVTLAQVGQGGSELVARQARLFLLQRP